MRLGDRGVMRRGHRSRAYGIAAAADGPVARKALALSAAQTAVDVNEAKNNEH